jgi:hypothetical protein
MCAVCLCNKLLDLILMFKTFSFPTSFSIDLSCYLGPKTGHHIGVFVDFHSHSRRIQGQYLKLRHDFFPPHPVLLFIQCDLVSIVKYPINK